MLTEKVMPIAKGNKYKRITGVIQLGPGMVVELKKFLKAIILPKTLPRSRNWGYKDKSAP